MDIYLVEHLTRDNKITRSKICYLNSQMGLMKLNFFPSKHQSQQCEPYCVATLLVPRALLKDLQTSFKAFHSAGLIRPSKAVAY